MSKNKDEMVLKAPNFSELPSSTSALMGTTGTAATGSGRKAAGATPAANTELVGGNTKVADGTSQAAGETPAANTDLKVAVGKKKRNRHKKRLFKQGYEPRNVRPTTLSIEVDPLGTPSGSVKRQHSSDGSTPREKKKQAKGGTSMGYGRVVVTDLKVAIVPALYPDDCLDEAKAKEVLATLERDRKSTRLNSSHRVTSRMPSSA